MLVNLVGHTAGARHVITEYSPAPVQALHYGYPGTSAVPKMGYFQLDAVVAPPLHARDVSERLAYFPFSHFVAAHAARYPHVPRASANAHPWVEAARGGRALERRAVASDGGPDPNRLELALGLSEKRLGGVALCNFNQLYKMDPDTYASWANALRRLPEASLWLSRVTVRKDSSTIAEKNLQAEAAALGVSLSRLGFAWKFPERDYLSFRALADLMLDNRLYNAHTTGADTLWAGVPAVALAARHLAGRASASFAHALGLASMVAPGLRAYEDSVHDLGARPERLHKLRRRLVDARDAAPFFDLDRLARAQQRLAHAMWGVHAAGYAPMHVIAAR